MVDYGGGSAVSACLVLISWPRILSAAAATSHHTNSDHLNIGEHQYLEHSVMTEIISPIKG